MVTAGVLNGRIQAICIKEILRIAQAGVYVGADPDIPGFGVLPDAVVVFGVIDLHFDPYILERSLRGLGQQRQFLTGRIGQPADGQLDAVFLADTVAIGINPAGILQDFLCLSGIIGNRVDSPSKGKAFGERAGSGVAVAFQ